MSLMIHRRGLLVPPRAPLIEFVSNDQSTSDLSTYTFSGMMLGAEDPTRRIIICASGRAGSGRDISTISVGGVSATELVDLSWGSNQNEIGIWAADVPTGITGEVVVTWSAAALRCGISLFRAVNLSSSAPTDTNSTSASGSTNPLSTSVGVEDGGFVIAASMSQNLSIATWTSVNKVSDQQFEISMSTAISGPMAAQTIAPQVSWGSPESAGLAVAAFR